MTEQQKKMASYIPPFVFGVLGITGAILLGTFTKYIYTAVAIAIASIVISIVMAILLETIFDCKD